MIRPSRLAILGLVCFCAAAVTASTGIVIDPKGEPLADIRVCYRAGNVEQLCVFTDESGAWELPPSSVDQVRLSHKLYIPQTIDGAPQAEPIIMHPGASLVVKLEDASGKPLTEGEVDVLVPSGKRFGPFPIQSAVGTRVNSLDPGPVVILGRSKGFAETRAEESDLPAGKETVVVLRLAREKPED